MSARDDYPRLVTLAGASDRHREEASRALDEIDRLRAELERVYTAVGEDAIRRLTEPA